MFKNNRYGNHSHHSKFLNSHFPLRRNGCDYINKNGVKFEFKECFGVRKVFCVKYRDVMHSDYIIFNNNNRFFYVAESLLFERYRYSNGKAQPSLKIIKFFAVTKFKSIKKLKEWIMSQEKKEKKDYYWCFHTDSNIVEQKAVEAGSESPICPRCGRVMTFGKWTSRIETGSIKYLEGKA